MTAQSLAEASARPTEPDDRVHLAEVRLGLLRDLEASLETTQKAVLARDLVGLGQGTHEQIRLHQALETVLDRTYARIGGPADGPWRLRCEPCLAAELHASAMRVLHLGRVQAALLVRAQRSLRMISNLLAGPESSYSPTPVPMPHSMRNPAPDAGEEHPCRA